MPINILMPALSPTMEKGNLAKWLKKEGDKVKSGDVIAEIETDKATMEVEAVDEGTLAKIVVPEGTADVPVNQVIAVLAGEGEDVKAAASGAKAAPAPAPAACKPEPPPRRRQAAPAAVSTGSCTPNRCAGRRSPRKPMAARRIFSSPLARRLAKEAGIDLAGIQGSGPHGRVIARDVDAAKSGKGLKAAARGRRGSCAARRMIAPAMGDEQDPRAVRRRLLRGHPARQHAQDHRAAAHAIDADHPAFLSHGRLQYRQAHGRARGDQRAGAEGQGRQARLQALGQRLRHQGAGARAAAHPERQCELDRSRHAQAQAFRCRRRGRDAGRPDHADHPQGRDQVAVGHLQRDEGFRRARARPASSSRRNIRAARPRCPISACTGSRISPR